MSYLEFWKRKKIKRIQSKFLNKGLHFSGFRTHGTRCFETKMTSSEKLLDISWWILCNVGCYVRCWMGCYVECSVRRFDYTKKMNIVGNCIVKASYLATCLTTNITYYIASHMFEMHNWWMITSADWIVRNCIIRASYLTFYMVSDISTYLAS